MKTIFFHIGQPKTATTTLQYFLLKNREWLAREGILYPVVPDNHPLKSQHRFLLEGLRHSKWNFIKRTSPEWEFMKKQIECSNMDKVVISEEGFWNYFCKKGLRRSAIRKIGYFLRGFDVKIICYLRRQDQWLESYYHQIVKSEVTERSRMPINEFVEYQEKNGMLDYFGVLSDLANEFGTENIHIKPFEKEQWLNSNIIDDFCSILSIYCIEGAAIPNALQVRLTNAACIFSLIFNRLPGAETAKERLTHILVRINKYNNTQRILPKIIAERVLSQYKETNRNVVRHFLRNREELFNDNRISLDYEDYPGLSIGELAEIVAYIFIDRQSRIDRIVQLSEHIRNTEWGAGNGQPYVELINNPKLSIGELAEIVASIFIDQGSLHIPLKSNGLSGVKSEVHANCDKI